MKKNKLETYNSNLIDELFDSISSEESEKIEKKMLLAAKINDAIKAKKWKKKDLADALHKRPSVISKWLSGTHNFNSDTLFDIGRVLGIVLISLDEAPKEQNVTIQISVSQRQKVSPNAISSDIWDSKPFITFQSKRTSLNTLIN